MKKAAFLDRDGTVIHDVHYLAQLEDCSLIPEIIPVLQYLQQAGYILVIVSNQSGVARGYFDEAFVLKTHDFLADMLAEHGIAITAFYFCPHHPTIAVRADLQQDCDCRKPKPGMLLQAAKELGVDLKASLMIGDSQRDLDAGLAAGCRAYHIDDVRRLQV
ncbi:HAD family hydrolase [Candidatus Dependentiae bacterium]|nr:HAD family hydrolase [Candidatus Dependentiae bacterium]